MSEKATAYHEAGHALVAYRFKDYGGIITIIPKGDMLGSSTSENAQPTKKGVVEQIIVLYSGFAAENKYDPGADNRGSSNDNERAADLLELTDETESSLRQRAEKIIDENWQIIEAIAEKLFIYKTLEEDEWSIIIDAFDEGDDSEKCFYKMRNFLINRRQS